MVYKTNKMTSIDSELRNRPIPWIPLGERVLDGTVGATLISSIPHLGERLRPQTIFNQNLTSLWNRRNRIVSELALQGITRLAQILDAKEGDQVYPNQPEIRERLVEFVAGLAFPPHVRFINRLSHPRTLYPVAPEREGEIISAVEDELAKLRFSPQGFRILSLLYGLDDGIHRTRREITEMEGISPELTLAVQRVSSWVLEARGAKRRLEGYLGLPPNCIAHYFVPDAVFRKDLPDIEGEDVHLSYTTRSEIGKNTEDWRRPDSYSARYLLAYNLDQHPLPPEALGEIQEKLEELRAEPLREQQPTQEEIEQETFQINLFPDSNLPVEQIEQIADMPIEAIVKSKSAEYTLHNSSRRIITIGELLALTPEQFNRINGIGPKRAEVVLGQLRDYLQLPGDKISMQEDSPVVSARRHVREVKNATLQKEQEDLAGVRRMVNQALGNGHSSAESIQTLISGQLGTFSGISTKSWKFTALVEYVLNHPESEGKT